MEYRQRQKSHKLNFGLNLFNGTPYVELIM